MRWRRGNHEADRFAMFVADQFRAPVADRRARITRELALDAMTYWVATAGAEAAEFRGDLESDY
eukprot:1346031-Pyramimonas_sp.AAC.1